MKRLGGRHGFEYRWYRKVWVSSTPALRQFRIKQTMDESEIDWRTVLKAYMAWVLYCEGITFVDSPFPGVSENEFLALQQIDEEVTAEE